MIEVHHLSKRYASTLAVDDLSFDVAGGQVTGFLGPNGSGKSTTMRMIMGLDHPDAGRVAVNGRPYRELPWPLREVGALLEAKSVHPGRSAYHHLWMLAQTNDLPRTRVDEVLELVGLASVARRRAGTFSLGMGQRLGIAAALLGDPGVLLFDEPVNGLDPEGIRWVRLLLKRLAAEGRTVFVSSHLMSEMALTADHLVVIGRGRLIAEQPVEQFIAERSGTQVRVRTPRPEPLTVAVVAAGGLVSVAADGTLEVTGLSAEAVGDLAAAQGIALHELTPQMASLEDAFMELTHESLEFHGEHDRPAFLAAPGGRRRRGGPAVTAVGGVVGSAVPPPGRRHAGAGGQLRAEWTKLRTVRSTTWTLVVTVVAVVGIGALATAVTAAHWRNGGIADRIGFDPTARSLAGLFLGQISIGVLGVLAMSAEYSSGTIRATLSAIPNRPLVLACKVAVFGVVALITSEVLTFAAFLLGQQLLKGSTPYATLGQPGVLRAVAGAGLVLTVIALFALGLATIIRHTAGAISVFVGLLLVLPLVLQAFPDSVQRNLIKYMPLVIAENMAATNPLRNDFGGAVLLAPWVGFALLCLYAAVAIVVGGILLVRRDA